MTVDPRNGRRPERRRIGGVAAAGGRTTPPWWFAAAGDAAVRLRRAGAERARRLLRLHRLGRPRARTSPSSASTTSPTCSTTPTRVQAIWHTLLIAVAITVIQNGFGLLLALGVNTRDQVAQRAAGVPVRPGGGHPDRDRLPVAQPARPGRRGQQPARRGRAGLVAAGLARRPAAGAVVGRRRRSCGSSPATRW